MPELILEYFPEDAPEEVPERYAASLERVNPRVFSKQKPRTTSATPEASPLVVDGAAERYAFLKLCIEFGLNAPQISKLSLSTPFKMGAHQSVYEAIETQGLGRLYTSRKIETRRKGYHNQTIMFVFMKMYGQASETRHSVHHVFRDEAPAPGVKFRPDLGMTIDSRRFLIEVQLSKLQFTRWRTKMQNYLTLYKKIKQPFRVLFLVENDIVNLREYAREILFEHPNLNLFLFMPLAQFDRQWDVLHEPCWEHAWTPRKLVSLL